MNILITGGTGMIGKALTKALLAKGHSITILTRQLPKAPPQHGVQYAHWNPVAGTIDRAAIKNANAVIHLAGANVADGRWTARRKQEIVSSRVQSGQLLVKAMQETPNTIETVVSASAIGWYGPDTVLPKPFVETDPADDSFLGKTCQQWEAAIAPVRDLGKRLVTYRIGIVLSRNGGAYAEFRKLMRFGMATILGNGKQVISWIHIADLVQLFMEAVENSQLNGVYNAVADKPVSNAQLMKTIANVKGGFHIMVPVPAFALKLGLGEMSIEVLKSATVSNEKIKAAGFSFTYPTIESAVRALEEK